MEGDVPMSIIMWRVVSFAVVMLLGTCLAGMAQSPASIRQFTPVNDDMLQHPNPHDWLMWRHGYQAWGYSPLTQITPQNVSRLQLPGPGRLSPVIRRRSPSSTTA
jgi:glucose dehydrogenase